MTDTLQNGMLLGDDFRIQRKLGEGGMGAVYLATQISVDRTVVVKTLHAEVTQTSDGLERFRREARILSSLQHPNIVTVHTYGQSDDALPYLVMEYVEGTSLAQLLDSTSGPLEQDRALAITSQLLSALIEAHSHEVLHRDLKPDNIMLSHTADGVERIKVLDFGIAKLLAHNTHALTADHALIGTPQYMSPEQIEGGHALDVRSDIYATGLILYEMLAGEHPIRAETPMQFLFNQVSQPVVSLRELSHAETLPEALDAIVMCALEKDRDKRFASAREMLDALKDCDPLRSTSSEVVVVHSTPNVFTSAETLAPESSAVTGDMGAAETLLPTQPSIPKSPEPASPTPEAVASPPPPSPPKRSNIAFLLAAVALFATGAVIAWLATRSGDPQPPKEPPPQAAQQDTDVTEPVTPEDTASSVIARAADVSEVKAAPTPPPTPDPPAVEDTPPPLDVVQVVAAGYSTYALMSNGDVRAWGANRYGALGGALPEGDSAVPVKVPGVEKAKVIFAGVDEAAHYETTACALLETGRTWCWGASGWGFPGAPEWPRSTLPPTPTSLKSPVSIDLCHDYAGFVDEDGNGQVYGPKSPDVIGTSTLREPPGLDGVPLRSIRVGFEHACALTQKGEVYCWGDGSLKRIHPDRDMKSIAAFRVEALSDIQRLDVGNYDNCALEQDGDLYCWGSSYEAGLTAVASFVVDFAVSSRHMCYVTDDGGVWCKGWSRRGALGIEAREADVPMRVQGLGTEHAVSVTLGEAHSCALTRSSEVYCWGNNVFGQLGDGTLLDRSIAQKVQHLRTPGPLPYPESGDDAFEKRESQHFTPPGPPPAGCPPPPYTLTFSHHEVVADPIPVRFAKLSPSSDDALLLTLADHDPMRKKSDYEQTAPIRGRSQRLYISLRGFSAKDNPAPPTGRYQATYPPIDDLHTWLFIRDRYLSPGFPQQNNFTPESHLTLQHSDGTWLCGTLDMTATEHGFRLQGDFAVRIAP